jgi:hypothetical protein
VLEKLMDDTSHLWETKNATLSDKSARSEYGISNEEIIDAIKAGELQYRESSMYGNPWFRLLRVEVERLVEKKYGVAYLQEKKFKKELAEINRELKTLNKRVSELEERKKELLGGSGSGHDPKNSKKR